MEISELNNFLFQISENKESRYRGFNFLYTETSFTNQYEEDSFSEEVFKWIKKTNKELNDKLKQTTNDSVKSTIESDKKVLRNIKNKEFLKQWIECVQNINDTKKKIYR